MQHRRKQPEALVVASALELDTQPPQALGIEELVAVRAEHPGVRPHVRQNEVVRARGMGDAHRLDVVELGRETGDDLPRAVRGRVVGNVNPVG